MQQGHEHGQKEVVETQFRVIVRSDGYTHSDFCSFTIVDGKVLFMPAAYGEWMELDTERTWDDISSLSKDLREWYNDGDIPRDIDDRAIPFQ